jgi:imidazolonepropionase-like amidohydrolase
MSAYWKIALGFAVSLVCSATSAAQSSSQAVLAIEHATVLPMTSDTALLDHTVLVSDGRITWVGPASEAQVPRAARRVNGEGFYLIPGLADMHVHIESVAELEQFVSAGITTVRNMRGAPKHLAWRRQVARGSLVGPTIFTSGPSINRSLRRDPRFVEIRTVADADRVVRHQAAAGYDMIKVLRGVNLPVYQRLLQVAREAGLPVVGHVVPEVGLERSLAAGQVTFEHAYNLRERSRLTNLFGNDSLNIDADARAVARAGAWVGTIASSRNGDCAPRTPEMQRHIAALRRARVRLLAGSDAGIGPVKAGTGLLCELATLVASGLTPHEALASATVNAGAFAKAHLRRAEVPFGTVTSGARADLVLLRSDPRRDIGALSRPEGVVLRGVWRPAVDR